MQELNNRSYYEVDEPISEPPNSFISKPLKNKQKNTNPLSKTKGADAKGTNVVLLSNKADVSCDSVPADKLEPPYRDAVCELCEKTVSLALSVPLSGMQAETRCNAETALARQIAMYLCHTTFSLLLTEIGLHFGRDRSTVSHACAVVEDKRDDFAFDVMICQLEALLNDARQAMGLCFKHGCYNSPSELQETASGLSVYGRAMMRGAL